MGSPNAGSTRPFPIAKFSELYFIAAEAAVKGATTTAGKTAYALINVLRARGRGFGNMTTTEIRPKWKTIVQKWWLHTPTTITIDYILAERSREYFAEGYRWYDLTRTQKWADLAGTYQICGSSYGDHTPQTVTRDIEDYLYLRPIPQGQLDGLEMTDAELDAYQNPGYN